MPAHELGASAARKVDVEAWMPSRGGFGEICSASNCTDYQSRRLDVRYRPCRAAREKEEEGEGATQQQRRKTAYVHTLNGTAVAVPRVLLAMLETHQQADGSVRIPVPLRPFVGGRDIIGLAKK